MSTPETEPRPPAWRLLLAYVRPHRWALLAGALLSLVTGATGLLLPLVAKGLIDDLSHDRAITGALGLPMVGSRAAYGSRTRPSGITAQFPSAVTECTTNRESASW